MLLHSCKGNLYHQLGFSKEIPGITVAQGASKLWNVKAESLRLFQFGFEATLRQIY